MMRLPGNIVLTAIGITVDSMTLTPLAENLPVANVNVVMFGKGTPRKIVLENTEALFSGILLEIEITTVLPEVRTVILGVARDLQGSQTPVVQLYLQTEPSGRMPYTA